MAGWSGVLQAVLWKAGLISVSSVLGDTSEAQDRETSKRFSGDESSSLSRVAQVTKRVLAFPGCAPSSACPAFIA